MLLFRLLNKRPLKHASIPTQTSNSWLCHPMVIVKLDISKAFGSLYARLVLDVLSGKVSHDYDCDIKIDEEFETTVHELKAYFGFFKLVHTCEV